MKGFNLAIIQLDTALHIQSFNEYAKQLYGWSDQILNKDYLKICNAAKIKPIISKTTLKKFTKTDTLVNIHTSEIIINDRQKKIEWSAYQQKSTNPKIYSIMLVGTDVTEVQMLQEKNNELQEYLDNILLHIPGFLYWKNKDSVYLGCNQNFAKAAGLNSPKDIIGKTDYDLAWGKTEAEIYRRDDAEALKGIVKFNFEEPQQQADGKRSIVLASKVPLRNQHGNITGVIGVYTDITDRKKAEEELKIAKERAEAADQAKTMFLANMSHDLKTPITGIVSTAEYFVNTLEDVEYKQRAENIVLSGLKFLELINEIIELARLKFADLSNGRVRFEIKQLIDDITTLLKLSIENKGLTFNVQFDTRIPTILIGNRWHVYRILLNLLSNAIKFTKKGSIDLNVELAKESRKNVILKITVEDTGVGIPDDKQAIIFDQFTRLTPSHGGIYQGNGLGLYIVKQFIEAMHGEIYVRSKLAKGSAFVCLIPFQKPLDTENKTRSEKTNEMQLLNLNQPTHKPAAIKQPSFRITTKHPEIIKDFHILIIEDDYITAQALTDTLRLLGYTADLAATKEKAISLFKAKQYNIVFMDLGLPDTDGYEITHSLREIEKTTKDKSYIVALSAHADKAIKVRCLKIGMDEVYSKPLLYQQAQGIFENYRLKHPDQSKCHPIT